MSWNRYTANGRLIFSFEYLWKQPSEKTTQHRGYDKDKNKPCALENSECVSHTFYFLFDSRIFVFSSILFLSQSLKQFLYLLILTLKCILKLALPASVIMKLCGQSVESLLSFSNSL